MFDEGCKCEECKSKRQAANKIVDLIDQKIKAAKAKGLYPVGIPMAKLKEILDETRREIG
jgi:hypothetical protein